MRKPDQRRKLLHLSIAGGVAIALGTVVSIAEAGQRSSAGSGFRTMSAPPGPSVPATGKGPVLNTGDGLFYGSMPRSQNNTSANPGSIGRGSTGPGFPGASGRGGKGQGSSASTGDGDGGKPPGRRPPKRPTGTVPLGPTLGTGVALGTVDPAFGGPALPNAGGSAAGRPRAHTVYIPPRNEPRFVRNQIVLEFPGEVTRAHTAPILARFKLTPLDRAYFPLTDTTAFLWRINDGRSVRTVLNQLRRAGLPFDAQANFIYKSAQQQDGATFAPPQQATPTVTPVVATSGARSAAGDPAQYALAKLRLGEAHSLATGNSVLVAVIDSGIDAGHPELQGVVAGSFDALKKPEKPHAHGTAIAGAIASHARLLGVAPAARILAIQAFGASGASAEATTFAIIKGVQHATAQRARIINMSFAGPQDPGLARHLAAAKASGIVLIAASGNFGPKSPPQYPAADPNVIAVSATDASDHLFRAANRGPHIAVTAPGVDILLPAPNADYQLSSGTSFAAAHVSGIAALILERKPDLSPEAVRNILVSTAKDLGTRGRDDEFGAGLVDAYQAILAIETSTAAGTVGGPPASAPPQVTAQ